MAARLFAWGFLLSVAVPLPGVTVTQGTRITLTVTAQGTQPFSYQWFKDGGKLPGSTDASLTFTSIASTDSGSYTATVSNSAGSTTSGALTLDVQGASSTITTQPVAQTIPIGHTARFVAASSSGAGNWQISTDGGATWRNLMDDSTYSGATTGTLTVNGVTAGMIGNQFRFVSGSAASSAVTLTVISAILSQPVGIAMNPSGALVVADATLNTVSTVTTAGSVSVLAGSAGSAGTSDGTGRSASFNQPRGLAVDSSGNFYVADSANATIRKITPAGVVTTFAGSAAVRGSADGSSATFSGPTGVAIDGSGNLYVTDATSHTLRKITPAGVVSTLAGGAGVAGSADGTGTAARFNHPTGVALDRNGNIYVADSFNNTIRKVTASGAVTTLAGLYGVAGATDDSGADARFNQPAGLAVDGAGNIFVADAGNSAIRKVTPAGAVTTVAGLPTIGGLLDGTGAGAWFNQPLTLAFDGGGNLWVADTGNAALRKVTAAGVVTTLTLSSSGSSGTETTTTTTTTTTSPPATMPTSMGGGSSGGGGGGGGGAPSEWFIGALALLVFLRRLCGGGLFSEQPRPIGDRPSTLQ